MHILPELEERFRCKGNFLERELTRSSVNQMRMVAVSIAGNEISLVALEDFLRRLLQMYVERLKAITSLNSGGCTMTGSPPKTLAR